MSSVACGEPLSLSRIPADRVLRLTGMTDEQLAVSLDPLPDGAPVVLRYHPPRAARSSSEVVQDVLDRLDTVVIELFPTWLPAADVIGTDSDFDLRVVREMAHRHAAETAHFGPFLADVAVAALNGRSPERPFSPQVRLDGLVRIIADSYRRAGVVLLTCAQGEDDAISQQCASGAFDWLVAQGGVGVWLTAGALPLVDRYPTWQVAAPAYVYGLSSDSPTAAPQPVDYPPLAGLPHPASNAEQSLERRLARCAWAVGRTWNQEYASHSLAPPIRVDLMWPDLRCVVEIDGPDHRGVLKYAADRRRDNGLMLDGFAVLRFTNSEIDDDPVRVLAVIETLLATKRHDEGKLP